MSWGYNIRKIFYELRVRKTSLGKFKDEKWLLKYWKGMKEEVSPRKQCMQSSRESRELLTQKTQKLQLDHRFQLRYTYTKFPFYLQVSMPLFSSPPLFSPFLPSTVSLIRPLSFTFTHTIHLFHRSPEV